jgi:hypothetical protein
MTQPTTFALLDLVLSGIQQGELAGLERRINPISRIYLYICLHLLNDNPSCR